jgi:hypothetical protein
MAQLFKIHVLHGHTSLSLSNRRYLTLTSGKFDSQLYDYEYRSTERGLERGELMPSGASARSRFRWGDGSSGKIEVQDETLNRLALTLEPRDAGSLIRTDSFYPGWRAFAGAQELKVLFEPPCFSRVEVPARTTALRFVYEPRPWRLGLGLAAAGLATLAILLAAFYKRRLIA